MTYTLTYFTYIRKDMFKTKTHTHMYVNMCIYEMETIVEDDEIWHIAMKKIYIHWFMELRYNEQNIISIY